MAIPLPTDDIKSELARAYRELDSLYTKVSNQAACGKVQSARDEVKQALALILQEEKRVELERLTGTERPEREKSVSLSQHLYPIREPRGY